MLGINEISELGLTDLSSIASILAFIFAIAVFVLSNKNNKLKKKYLTLLNTSNIINTLPKGNIETITVQDFIRESKEENLTFGDVITILTNELEHYDLLPEYVDILVGNLKKSVTYNYYIPNNADIRVQSVKLCEAIANKAENEMQILNHIHFYTITVDSIYNFAVINIGKDIEKYYWYFAFEANKSDANLAIVSFNKDSAKLVKKIISNIQENSNIESIKENLFHIPGGK